MHRIHTTLNKDKNLLYEALNIYSTDVKFSNYSPKISYVSILMLRHTAAYTVGEEFHQVLQLWVSRERLYTSANTG